MGANFQTRYPVFELALNLGPWVGAGDPMWALRNTSPSKVLGLTYFAINLRSGASPDCILALAATTGTASVTNAGISTGLSQVTPGVGTIDSAWTSNPSYSASSNLEQILTPATGGLSFALTWPQKSPLRIAPTGGGAGNPQAALVLRTAAALAAVFLTIKARWVEIG